MWGNDKDKFSKLEHFLLRLALVILLVIALLKVIVPEIKSLTMYFGSEQESVTHEHQPASGMTASLSP
jgi:hypothetical protein